MNTSKKKRRLGLVGLYLLLVTVSALIRQVKYYGITAMLMIILTFLVLVILWGLCFITTLFGSLGQV